jgi:hypothetical protein
MSGILIFVLTVQVLTFIQLGVWFLSHGNWRLGIAQLLLSAVQAIIYSGGVAS